MRAISEHMSAMPGMDDMKDDGPFFDNELRAIYAAEMHDWKALAVPDAGAGIKSHGDVLYLLGAGNCGRPSARCEAGGGCLEGLRWKLRGAEEVSAWQSLPARSK